MVDKGLLPKRLAELLKPIPYATALVEAVYIVLMLFLSKGAGLLMLLMLVIGIYLEGLAATLRLVAGLFVFIFLIAAHEESKERWPNVWPKIWDVIVALFHIAVVAFVIYAVISNLGECRSNRFDDSC